MFCLKKINQEQEKKGEENLNEGEVVLIYFPCVALHLYKHFAYPVK